MNSRKIVAPVIKLAKYRWPQVSGFSHLQGKISLCTGQSSQHKIIWANGLTWHANTYIYTICVKFYQLFTPICHVLLNLDDYFQVSYSSKTWLLLVSVCKLLVYTAFQIMSDNVRY